MYAEDFTKYKYLDEEEDNVLTIGWLDTAHPFAKGTSSEIFRECLFRLCETPVNRRRGFHLCPFCDNPPFGLEVIKNGRKVILGSAEIRLNSASGIVFAAPDLIYHYVTDHRYLPPDEFINAALLSR